jgi:hypothetical protein
VGKCILIDGGAVLFYWNAEGLCRLWDEDDVYIKGWVMATDLIIGLGEAKLGYPHFTSSRISTIARTWCVISNAIYPFSSHQVLHGL